jgi:branched-chain amino acid transport system ATP-binding protein
MKLLEVNRVTKHFGGICAINDVTMELHEGELIGLIGPNGAGKTTLFNLITGVYVPTEGTVTSYLNGHQVVLNKMAPYKITKLGFARTFQNIRLFKQLTVINNVKIAMHKNVRYTFIEGILRLPRFYQIEAQLQTEAMALLKIFELDDLAYEQANNLPYGKQRRLEIARALATKPKVLFLDEPAAGMNPQETAELTKLIRWIGKEFNLTILLIEHDMSLVMNLCERLYVLDYGSVIAEGDPSTIKNNPRVIEAYLGEEV